MNPLLFLPLDGVLGLENGAFHRDGYGVSFSGEVVSIASNPLNQNALLQTLRSSGSANNPQVVVRKSQDFESLNETSRGTVLVLKRDEIAYSPSIATPVVMKVLSRNNAAKSFYAIRKDGAFIASGETQSIWSGVSSTVGGVSCTDFEQKPLQSVAADRTALSFQSQGAAIGDCVNASSGAQPSQLYGFNWPNVCTTLDDQFVYLESAFFTPTAGRFEIVPACSQNFVTTAGGDNVGPGGSASLSNPYILLNTPIASIEDLLQNVRSGKMCASVSPTQLEVFWNPTWLHQQMAQQYPGEATESICPNVIIR